VRWAQRVAAVIGAAAVVLLLASCAAPSDGGGPDPGLRGQWELESGTDQSGEIPLANQLISLTIDGDNTTTGRSTCSDYRAHVYGTEANLWVTVAVIHAGKCGSRAQHEIEQRYLADLGRVRGSTIDGGVLDLLAPGIDLRFARALTVPTTLIVNRTWRLTMARADDYDASANATYAAVGGASMRLDSSGIMSGNTGCHGFTARFLQNAGEIVARDLVVTPSSRCSNANHVADAALLRVIAGGFTFISESGALSISSPRAQLTLDFVD